MNDPNDALSQRIVKLERTNRILALVTGAVVIAVVYSAGSTPRAVRAESFQFVTPDGAVRAELVLRSDAPGLFLKDADGGDRVAMFHDTTTSGLHVMDANGTTRIGVAQFSHGGGGFALHGPESKGAAVLYLKGEGSLRFFDTDGAVTNQVLAAVAQR